MPVIKWLDQVLIAPICWENGRQDYIKATTEHTNTQMRSPPQSHVKCAVSIIYPPNKSDCLLLTNCLLGDSENESPTSPTRGPRSPGPPGGLSWGRGLIIYLQQALNTSTSVWQVKNTRWSPMGSNRKMLVAWFLNCWQRYWCLFNTLYRFIVKGEYLHCMNVRALAW